MGRWSSLRPGCRSASRSRGLTGKWLLRQVARSVLPPQIANRAKWGFKVPTERWFRGPLAGLLRHVLLSRTALARGKIRPEAVRALIDAHVSGHANHDKRLWSLFQLELGT